MKIPLYQIDAFAERPFAGNPAAVCPLDHWLEETILQSIAMENNLSETAFLVGGGGAYELRWFTPACEVDLCGHATLASAYVVFNNLEPDCQKVRFLTRSGDLFVERHGDDLSMSFPALPGEACPVPDGLSEAIGADIQEAIDADDLMVIVKDEASVQSLDPDMMFIATKLSHRGLIVSAPGENCDFVSRFFGPAVGIPEDPVTGSAHCISAPYWGNRLGKTKLQARQISKRGGTLTCELDGDRVILTGPAIPYLEGMITI
ncbi:MAG: PhzF family phenazine biosynthesis protein [Rhodospirillaceae bacterium]|nr:PhzF family phenazine biosynthesis protein [Rhodospirillaceae bacterium]MBL6942195.1 PhzF family phenazine biosynthesis protein [Rhodospirillales bacterium]